MQTKHFTAPQKMHNFQFTDEEKTCKLAVEVQSTQRAPEWPENYCESKQTYFKVVMVSTKPFTCQSFRQNYFSRQIEWADWGGGGGRRQPINLSTPSPLTLPPLPGGSVSLPLPTPPGGSTLPSLSCTITS